METCRAPEFHPRRPIRRTDVASRPTMDDPLARVR
jgi:hypothetical protein